MATGRPGSDRPALARARREERVAIWLEKRVETVATVFGTSAAGGVFVPVNPVLRPPQVAYILAQLRCPRSRNVTRAPRACSRTSSKPARRSSTSSSSTSDDLDGADERRAIALHAWSGLGRDRRDGAARPAVDADMAAIFYTSGSTGKPKGVVLSHRNLLVGAESVSHYLGNRARRRHPVGLAAQLRCGLQPAHDSLRSRRARRADELSPRREVLKLCKMHGVTGLTCVPPLWIQIADLEWPAEVSGKLRYFAAK